MEHRLAAFGRLQGWSDSELAVYAGELERRYCQGESSDRIAETLDGLVVSSRTIRTQLNKLGVQMRGPGRPRLPRPGCRRCGKPVPSPKRVYCDEHAPRRHPPAEPRVCELARCSVIFTPESSKLARGAGGRFCSYDHWTEWRRGKPQREWKQPRHEGADLQLAQ